MMQTITQMQRDIIYQSDWILHSKVEILNRNFKIIHHIEGNLLDDTFSIDSDSDLRRTYNCSLVVTDSSFILDKKSWVWLDTFIRPYVGIEHLRSGEIVWNLMGTYTPTEVSYDDDESYILSIDCGDLITMINGDRGGHFIGLSTKIEAATDAYKALTGILKEAGITRYIIEDVDFEIPYDLEFGANVTAYEMLEEIRDLYPGYEMGFDVYGTFFFRKIPFRFEDNVVLDDAQLRPLVIKESRSTTLKEIYNHIQVWGQVIDTDRYADSSTLTEDTYHITLEDINSMNDIKNFLKIAFKNDLTNPDLAYISINRLEKLPIVDDSGTPLAAGTLPAGVDVVFKYRKKDKAMYYLGQYQVFGEAYDENPDSPFKIDTLGKELLYVCEGGDYDNIYSNDLACQRARYEIYNHTVLNSALELDLASIPWLDVNQKISYIPQKETVEKQYIIKSISGSTTDAVMSISCISFYPSYKYNI